MLKVNSRLVYLSFHFFVVSVLFNKTPTIQLGECQMFGLTYWTSNLTFPSLKLKMANLSISEGEKPGYSD